MFEELFRKEVNMNICLCTKDDSYRIRKNFESYDDLLKWTKEQIKEEESKINIGDNVKIIDEGEMYTSLGTEFFSNVYWAIDDITEEQMFDIIRYYKYNPHKIYEGIDTSMVVGEYDDKYVLSIPSNDYWHVSDYIVIGKEGVKKINA